MCYTIGMSVNLEPIGDRVIVQTEETGGEKILPGGLVIPATNDSKTQKGTVVAVSSWNPNDAGKHIPIPIKVGQTVLFGQYDGQDIPEYSDLLLLNVDGILAVVK